MGAPRKSFLKQENFAHISSTILSLFFLISSFCALICVCSASSSCFPIFYVLGSLETSMPKVISYSGRNSLSGSWYSINKWWDQFNYNMSVLMWDLIECDTVPLYSSSRMSCPPLARIYLEQLHLKANFTRSCPCSLETKYMQLS